MWSAVAIILFLGVAAWLGAEFVKDFASAKGSLWDRLLAAGKDSATWLAARVLAILGSLAGLGENVGDYLGDPAISAAVRGLLSPEIVPYYALFAAVTFALARRRTKK